jgi:hypothetical protein
MHSFHTGLSRFAHIDLKIWLTHSDRNYMKVGLLHFVHNDMEVG